MEDPIARIRTLVKAGQPDQALDELNAVVKQSSDHLETLILLNARFNDLNNRIIQQRIAYQQEQEAKSQLNYDILSLLKVLKEADFKSQNESPGHQQIENSIGLYLPPGTNRNEQLSFFRALRLTNITPLTFGEMPEPDTVDFLILNNRDLPFLPSDRMLEEIEQSTVKKVEERIEHLDNLWAASEAYYFIHFGEVLFWVNDHRSRVHAANSPISLYARIREMIDFLDTIQVGKKGIHRG